MRPAPATVRQVVSTLPEEPSVRAVLALLHGHYRCAQILGRLPRTSAAEVTAMASAQLTDAQLRVLIDTGLVERVVEKPRDAAGSRYSSVVSPARGEPIDRLALTPRGASVVVRLEEREGSATPRPCWVSRDRKLWLGNKLVKRFRRRAENQQSVLASFERRGWPEYIKDPLPPDQEVDPGERLRETVRSLNTLQVHPLILFSVTADRREIRWEPASRRKGHHS
jgi:hypothetical protein